MTISRNSSKNSQSHQTRVQAGKKAAKTRGRASLAEAGRKGGKVRGKKM